jgi:asparagine synthase (glutamine-hydrolysing)
MCGITGVYSFEGSVDPKCIKRMTDLLRHRGPDDEGFLAVDSASGKVFSLIGSESKIQGARIENFNRHTNLLFGHRRLSIIDISPAGHQPMSNEDESLWVVHNGEIYNYLEIRKELVSLGHRFKSQTDTEVILHAYEEWKADCLSHFNGMWAFAIHDLRHKRIFCSRDRAGLKPFYYVYDGKRFCFASEIKALLEMDDFSVEPNEQIIADYLFSGLIDHTRETFFKGVYQLRPGEYLLIENNGLKIKSYWDIEPNESYSDQEDNFTTRFYALLEDSIRLRLRTDVPIGTCLSGGLDSSSIVCLANQLMFNGQNIDPRLVGKSQKTFSSCFEEPFYDERKFIELVTEQTGAEKNYVFPKEKQLFNELPKLIWHQDEPFGSTSIYAQWKVMKLARERQVIVLLDGQGGDELLAGYLPSFYFMIKGVLKEFDLGRLIKEMAGLARNHGNELKPYILGLFTALVPTWAKPCVREFTNRDTGWAVKDFRKRYFRDFPDTKKFSGDLNNYLYQIYRYSILPGLLHYEDRNSMAFSLETRLPFLDYRLVEFIFGLPVQQKIQDGTTKVILRNAMKGILPEVVRNRMDKMGFATPEDNWFKTVLRNQIYEIICSKSFGERGYFEENKVKHVFEDYCKGKVSMSFAIWRWVNLELWLRLFVDKKPWSENCGDNGIL